MRNRANSHRCEPDYSQHVKHTAKTSPTDVHWKSSMWMNHSSESDLFNESDDPVHQMIQSEWFVHKSEGSSSWVQLTVRPQWFTHHWKGRLLAKNELNSAQVVLSSFMIILFLKRHSFDPVLIYSHYKSGQDIVSKIHLLCSMDREKVRLGMAKG